MKNKTILYLCPVCGNMASKDLGYYDHSLASRCVTLCNLCKQKEWPNREPTWYDAEGEVLPVGEITMQVWPYR